MCATLSMFSSIHSYSFLILILGNHTKVLFWDSMKGKVSHLYGFDYVLVDVLCEFTGNIMSVVL